MSNPVVPKTEIDKLKRELKEIDEDLRAPVLSQRFYLALARLRALAND